MAEEADPEQAESDAKVAEIERGGAGDVVAEPNAPDVVESQEKSVRTEKGKMIIAEEDSEEMLAFPIGTRVLCSSLRDDELHRTAEVVNWREAKTGMIKYYVHYIGHDKRLDEWLPSTRVQKLNQDISSSLNPLSVTPTSPAEVGLGIRNTTGTPEMRITRSMQRRFDFTKPTEELTAIDQLLDKEHEEKTKLGRNIQAVWLGKHEIDAWYYSPYPQEYHQDRLYVCEFCLKYMRKKKTIDKHKVKCALKYPPGNEIYQTTAPITDDQGKENELHLSVYEVDGNKDKLYCQNLCLLAGLFLDHKAVHYEVDPFLFYILTENDASGKHLVAYFSKEMDSEANHNISCILTLPPFQRKGYGQFLADLAYTLSKKEGKVGTPERPLSDLGKTIFTSYWKRILLEIIRGHRNASIEDLTKWTSIRSDDVVSTLKPLGLVKYWKAEYVPAFANNKRTIDNHLKTLKPQPDWLKIDTSKLNWPFKEQITAPKKSRTPRKPSNAEQNKRARTPGEPSNEQITTPKKARTPGKPPN